MHKVEGLTRSGHLPDPAIVPMGCRRRPCQCTSCLNCCGCLLAACLLSRLGVGPLCLLLSSLAAHVWVTAGGPVLPPAKRS